jgi:hypothetical protein
VGVDALPSVRSVQNYKNKLAVPSSATYIDSENFTGDSEEPDVSIK